MIKEIGGFFGEEAIGSAIAEIQTIENTVYSLSGTASLKLIIKDIQEEKTIKTVLMPDYCCYSMIRPFLEEQIEIMFYKIVLDEYGFLAVDIESIENQLIPDVFVHMRYFGFKLENEDELHVIQEQLRGKGVIIIEDITHSYFRRDVFKSNSDYYVSSLRKWAAVASGGQAIKSKDSFVLEPCKNSEGIVESQLSYMKVKRDGFREIDGNTIYSLNLEFNKKLNYYDWRFKIDKHSLLYWENLDIQYLKNTRIRNALYLKSYLQNSSKFQILANFDNLAVPLYIPTRYLGDIGQLKTTLFQNKIFLPTHWPNKVQNSNDLWKTEISFVCDQRYTLNDMDRIIKIIDNIID